MLLYLIFLANLTQLFIEIYREYKTFKRELRAQMMRENYRRVLMQPRNNNNDLED